MCGVLINDLISFYDYVLYPSPIIPAIKASFQRVIDDAVTTGTTYKDLIAYVRKGQRIFIIGVF